MATIRPLGWHDSALDFGFSCDIVVIDFITDISAVWAVIYRVSYRFLRGLEVEGHPWVAHIIHVGIAEGIDFIGSRGIGRPDCLSVAAGKVQGAVIAVYSPTGLIDPPTIPFQLITGTGNSVFFMFECEW